jgi:hypothetical protein
MNIKLWPIEIKITATLWVLLLIYCSLASRAHGARPEPMGDREQSSGGNRGIIHVDLVVGT